MLSAVAVVLFFATRRISTWYRQTRAHEAAAAYARGLQASQAGDLTLAVKEFRRAVIDDRSNREYTLGLARALAESAHGDEAERLLLQLREESPDDAEINYRLGRLAVARDDLPTAVRYYNHAMYGVTDVPELDRQHIRTELIGVLLDHGDRDGAIAELAALSRELPDEPAAHLEAGRLASRAGEQDVALEQFRRAAELDPKSADARLGVARAALAIHDFRQAANAFETAVRLGAAGQTIGTELTVARLALATDPLARGLPIAERVSRLRQGMDWVATQLDACPATAQQAGAPQGAAAAASAPSPAAGGASARRQLESDRAELERLRHESARALRDTDVIAAGVELIGRLRTAVDLGCPDAAPAPLSDAWQLIADAHGRAQ